MTTLRIKIETLEQTMEALAGAMKAAAGQAAPRSECSYSFPTWEAMHRVLSPKRLEIMRVMTGQGPLSKREVARRVGRDFKAVHADIETLLNNGVIDRSAEGVVFPYDRIHFEFEIESAA